MKKLFLFVCSLNCVSVMMAQSWNLTGNAGTNPATNFVGTRDSHPLRFRIFNQYAGEIDSTTGKTFFGYNAGKNTSTGTMNTAMGFQALLSNSTGYSNVATGAGAMQYNTTGYNNSVQGAYALFYNTAGYFNTAIGAAALWSNSSGSFNTAVGASAMTWNQGSLGHYNTAIGSYALYNTTNSEYNTAVGYRAGIWYDLGYNNTILGANCGGSFPGQYNMIAIGQGVTCPDNSTARIGNSATWSIGGYAGWSNFSDGRFKKDIKEDVKGLDFIMKLRPVTYHLDITNLSKQLKENQGEEWNQQMKLAMEEKEKMLQTGFVAQEVEQAAKEVGFDFNGVDKPKSQNGFYALRYAEFVVPLVKAVQEQQQLIKDLQSKVQQLQEQADVTVLIRETMMDDKVSAYPNPANNNMVVTINTQTTGSGMLQIFDGAGKLVKQVNINVHKGMNAINLSIPDIAAGYYDLKLDWGQGMHKHVSIVKQ